MPDRRPLHSPLTRRAPRRRVGEPLRLGFLAGVDCAPLLVAREQRLFEKEGLDVRLSCEVGWVTIREKLASGELEAAQAVCGLSLTLPLGLQMARGEVGTAFVFNRHGNAVTLSQDLWRRGVRGAEDFGKLVRGHPGRLFTLATVSRASAPHFLLCRWLQSAGLDPKRHVRVIVLPPAQMASSLKAGLIDGFCGGEPWNSLAVTESSGWVAATSANLASRHPEKVLLAGPRLLNDRAAEHAGLIRALHAACAMCDEPVRRPAVARLLADSGVLRTGRAVLEKSLVGPFDIGVGEPQQAGEFHIFHRGDANRPALDCGRWVARELAAHGSVGAARESALRRQVSRVWREDIYQAALGSEEEGPGAKAETEKPQASGRGPLRSVESLEDPVAAG